VEALPSRPGTGYHAPTMLRDPQGRMLALGVALAALANVLLITLITRPGAIAAIPPALPVLFVVAVVGLVLICHNGRALARRRRERRPHG
jgi:hypothetical protein